MSLDQSLRPTPRRQHLRAPAATAAALAAIFACGATTAGATEYPKRFEVVRDAKGREVATVECSGIISECVIRDAKGRRTGTLDQEPVEQEPREPTLEEIIEETRRREPEPT